MSGWDSSNRPGSTRAGRTMRARVLREEPTCRWPDCTEPSTEDDHIVGWSQRERHGISIGQWHARSNHQGLCATHHQAKTTAEAQAGKQQRRRPSPRHFSEA